MSKVKRRKSKLALKSVLWRLVAGCTIICTLLVQAVQGGLRIETASLPTGMEMTPYSVELEVLGGTPPYSWSSAQGFVEFQQPNSFAAVGTAWQSGMDQTY